MKNNISNKVLYILVFCLLLICFTGCGGLKITESESQQIAEYAAGLLLKYDRNYSGSLRNVELPEEVAIVNDPPEEAMPEEPATAEEEVIDSNPEIPTKGSANDNEPIYSNVPINEFIQADGLTINYTYSEVVNEYPDSKGEDVVFSMQPEQGNSFLVVHFDLTNTTGEDLNVDLLSKKIKYRAVLNDEDVIQNNKTILLNDLEQYSDVVLASQTVDTVLIFEDTIDKINSISKLDLNIKFNKEKADYNLY